MNIEIRIRSLAYVRVSAYTDLKAYTVVPVDGVEVRGRKIPTG